MNKKQGRLTEEQQREQAMNNSLNDVLRDLEKINEPSISFNIGQRVRFGHIQYAEIVESFEKGKYYKVFLRSIKQKQHSEETIIENYHRYMPWHEISPYKTPEENSKIPVLRKKQDWFFQTYQSTLDSILMMYYHFGLNMEPDYQRGNVWSVEDKQNLIGSIFNNVEIGKLALIKNEYTDKYLYEVLDGKQRIQAIIDFYESRFTYEGLYFCDMCNQDQSHFTNYLISYCVTTEMTQQQRYEYFLTINKTGKLVDENHLKYVETLLRGEQNEKAMV